MCMMFFWLSDSVCLSEVKFSNSWIQKLEWMFNYNDTNVLEFLFFIYHLIDGFSFWGKMQNWSVEILGCRTRNTDDFWNRKIECLGKSSALMTHIWQFSAYKWYLMSWDWVMSPMISANEREKRTKYWSLGTPREEGLAKQEGEMSHRHPWWPTVSDALGRIKERRPKHWPMQGVGPGESQWNWSDFWWSSGNLRLIKECLGDN